VNALFADQMGVMILDEPTDGLDRDNRRLAADVFTCLGDVAKKRGYQVVVVTHDDILRRCFDQVLTLDHVA
jgi:DNA repair exonuclease SbcCD ATPase subunit